MIYCSIFERIVNLVDQFWLVSYSFKKKKMDLCFVYKNSVFLCLIIKFVLLNVLDWYCLGLGNSLILFFYKNGDNFFIYFFICVKVFLER